MLRRAVDLLQIVPDPGRRLRVIHGDVVKADDGVHRRPDLVTHVRQERGLGLVRLLGCRQGVAQCLLLADGLSRLAVNVRKAGADAVNIPASVVLRPAHRGEADHLIGLPAVAFYHVRIRDDSGVPQPLLHRRRLNELHKLFPVGFRDILLRVSLHRVEIREMLSRLESVRKVRVLLIADAVVLVQFNVVDAPVIRAQRGDQPALLFPLLLLLEQLILQGKPLFHLRPLHAVLCIRGLLLHREARVAADLPDDEKEHGEHGENGRGGLNEASPYDAVRDRLDLPADHALADQIRQHPVGPPHRHIAQRLPDIVISK